MDQENQDFTLENQNSQDSSTNDYRAFNDTAYSIVPANEDPTFSNF